ncbi:MAG: FHS family L-fucose permease-like MFS transporter, partial [Saprospiraceae bacterium]
ETTANPFILSMGPKETATQRLNLAQAFNPIGALAGLYAAQNFILGSLQSDDLDAQGNAIYETLSETAKATVRSADLLAIRNPYVILGIAVIAILILIAVVAMPEQKEEDTEESVQSTISRIFKNAKFREGVLAQMFYVGAQIMCWTYIYQYAETLGIDNRSAVPYAMSALIIFLIGRWICTWLLRSMDAGKLLMYFAYLAIIFTLGAIFIQGMVGLYSLVMISFCMSLMFPTIYGIALEDIGEDAKFGAAFLVMAIVGGAIMPMAQGMILDIGGSGYSDVSILGVPEVNFSFVLPIFCFLYVARYGYRAFKIF